MSLIEFIASTLGLATLWTMVVYQHPPTAEQMARLARDYSRHPWKL